MSRLYRPVHRSLQDRFDTRRLADNIETRVVLTEIRQEHKAFIESRDMFFLSTIDHQGRPTVSTRAAIRGSSWTARPSRFPATMGNGMFYSMGNLLGNPQVGMLFVNFEKPHRLRLRGIASIDNDPLLQEYAEAQLVIRVTVSKIFRNCPRYVHRYKKFKRPNSGRVRHAKHPLRHGSALTTYRPSCRQRIVLASNAKAV